MGTAVAVAVGFDLPSRLGYSLRVDILPTPSRTIIVQNGSMMTQNELFTKLVKQYQQGLITMEEFHGEVVEANLIHKLGINEGIAR